MPISPYGITNLSASCYCRFSAAVTAWRMSRCDISMFSVRGRIPVRRTLACWRSSAPQTLNGKPLIFGDGEQTRDFTYVENAVQANLLAFEAPNVSGKVFNVGVGGRVSLNEVTEVLARFPDIRWRRKHEPQREGDIRDSQADITQAREVLGYDPRVDFEEGLRRTFEWYKVMRAKAQKAEQVQGAAEHPQAATTK